MNVSHSLRNNYMQVGTVSKAIFSIVTILFFLDIAFNTMMGDSCQ